MGSVLGNAYSFGLNLAPPVNQMFRAVTNEISIADGEISLQPIRHEIFPAGASVAASTSISLGG